MRDERHTGYRSTVLPHRSSIWFTGNMTSDAGSCPPADRLATCHRVDQTGATSVCVVDFDDMVIPTETVVVQAAAAAMAAVVHKLGRVARRVRSAGAPLPALRGLCAKYRTLLP